MPEDLYALLGVPHDADAATLKKAYRRLAKELHPDRNASSQAEARFKAVGRAYAVLSDSKRRDAYDASAPPGGAASRGEARAGKTPVRRVRVSRAPETYAFTPGPARGPENGLEMLSSLFRRASRRVQEERGSDHHATVSLSLGEALRGATLDLEGLLPSALVRVLVPKGSTDGTTVRVPDLGGASPSVGANGDLVVTLRVEPHPRFRVEDRDLHVDVPVTLREAYAGAKIDVPTPAGPIEIRIPPRSQSGTVLRVKGRGVPAAGPGLAAGNLFVRLEVHIPTGDSAEIAALVERLAALQDEAPRAELVL